MLCLPAQKQGLFLFLPRSPPLASRSLCPAFSFPPFAALSLALVLADPPYPAGGPSLPGRRALLTRQAAGGYSLLTAREAGTPYTLLSLLPREAGTPYSEGGYYERRKADTTYSEDEPVDTT